MHEAQHGEGSTLGVIVTEFLLKALLTYFVLRCPRNKTKILEKAVFPIKRQRRDDAHLLMKSSIGL